ncbi:MAG: hypothetical protein REH79_01275 [Spiroplasma sp.]|nr:hypothetical protein [Spiroplasma sp.]
MIKFHLRQLLAATGLLTLVIPSSLTINNVVNSNQIGRKETIKTLKKELELFIQDQNKTKQDLQGQIDDLKNQIKVVNAINETNLKIMVIKKISRTKMYDNIKLYLVNAIKTTNQIKTAVAKSFEDKLFKVTNIEVTKSEINKENIINPENLIIKYDYSTIKNQSIELKVNIIDEEDIHKELFKEITFEKKEVMKWNYQEFKNKLYDIFLQRFNDITTDYVMPDFKSWFEIEIGYGKKISNIKTIEDDKIFNEFKNKINDNKSKEKFYILTKSKHSELLSIFWNFNFI